jgi:hypothetical protein
MPSGQNIPVLLAVERFSTTMLGNTWHTKLEIAAKVRLVNAGKSPIPSGFGTHQFLYVTRLEKELIWKSCQL